MCNPPSGHFNTGPCRLYFVLQWILPCLMFGSMWHVFIFYQKKNPKIKSMFSSLDSFSMKNMYQNTQTRTTHCPKGPKGNPQHVGCRNHGREPFRATMSLESFHIISRIFRFDNQDDRPAPRQRNKRAAIAVGQVGGPPPPVLQPWANATIDEQLPL